jgi:hypothetical protein
LVNVSIDTPGLLARGINAFPPSAIFFLSPAKVKKIVLATFASLTAITAVAAIVLGIYAIQGLSCSILLGIVTVGSSAIVFGVIIVAIIALRILVDEIKQNRHLENFLLNSEAGTGEAILKMLHSFPECATLIKEANDVIQRNHFPPLEIRVENFGNGSEARQCDNIIRILPGLSARKMLGLAIFELHNLTTHEQFTNSHDKINRGQYSSAEEYTKDWEKIEYHNLIRCNVIINKINQQRRYFKPYAITGWEKKPLHKICFEKYYNSLLSNSHKNNCREFYKKHTDELASLYEKANRNAQEALAFLENLEDT